MTAIPAANNRQRRDVGPAVHERLEARAGAIGITIHGLCRRVGLDPSVANRWKRGATPSLVTYLLLDDELTQMELDQERGAPE